MNTAYFGSPNISAELLQNLLDSKRITIKLIITQPDKAVGKRLLVTPTQVKCVAIENNIPYFDLPLNENGNQDLLLKLLKEHNIELGILFAYGELIKQPLLDFFPQGIWNIHPSLLPLYRGSSPLVYPIMLGDNQTGITLMKLVKKMDAGPILIQNKIQLDKDVTLTRLQKTIIPLSQKLILSQIELLSEGKNPTESPQNEAHATFTRQLTKNDGYVRLSLLQKALDGSSILIDELPEIVAEYIQKYSNINIFYADQIIYNLYRAFTSWPGLWTVINTTKGEKRLKIIEMTKENSLIITKVQLEGKPITDFKIFNKSYSILTSLNF